MPLRVVDPTTRERHRQQAVGEFGQRSQPWFPKRYKRAEVVGYGILTPRGLFPRRGKNTSTVER